MKPHFFAASAHHHAVAATLHGTVVTPATAVPAALLSPLLSCVGIVCYERWRGSAVNLNLFKCTFAASLFAIVVSTGPPIAAVLTPLTLRMLVLSAFLGVVVGDLLWLQALKLLGARLTILMSTLQPLLAALAGAVFLKQPLAPSAALGIAAVCSGLALAQNAPPPPTADSASSSSSSSPSSPMPLEDAKRSSDIGNDNGSEMGGSSDIGNVRGRSPTSSPASGRSKLAVGILLNVVNLGFDIAGTVITLCLTHCTPYAVLDFPVHSPFSCTLLSVHLWSLHRVRSHAISGAHTPLRRSMHHVADQLREVRIGTQAEEAHTLDELRSMVLPALAAPCTRCSLHSLCTRCSL